MKILFKAKERIRKLMLVFSFALFLSPVIGIAADGWEIAILFLGRQEGRDYQLDIDNNLLELAKMKSNQRIGILREVEGRLVEYFPDPKSAILSEWSPLFFQSPAPGVQISGEFHVNAISQGTVLDSEKLTRDFLSKVFRDQKKKRLLILYGHGNGFSGLKLQKTLPLQDLLFKSLPKRAGKPLDILWMESCFMANLEAAFQFRKISDFYISSEDAEFSSGAPFDMLEFLADDARLSSLNLAERYIESYSYSELGSQRKNVFKSSATISVLETAKLDHLVKVIKNSVSEWKRFFNGDRDGLARKLKRFQMENPELIDFGSVAKVLGSKELETLLELNQEKIRKSNPRLFLAAPIENSRLVFGFEEWTKGFKGDEVLEKLPAQLKPEGFAKGRFNLFWPYRNIAKRQYLNPFTVGLMRFDYYFEDANGKQLTTPSSFQRDRDFFTYAAKNPLNPVLLTAYTQGLGNTAEIYTGLSIANPIQGIPSIDYTQLEFYEQTRWADFF